MMNGDQAVQAWTALPPTPRTWVTKMNVEYKYVSLTEMMYMSLTTNNSKIIVQLKLANYSG